MTIAVILEQVPDVVEELAIAPSGNELDRDTVTYVLNEYDDHALEEALLLAEASGDEVIAVGIDTTGELDQALYTALAKGAKRAIKLVGDFEETWLSTRATAEILAPILRDLAPRLVLTGVQAPDDLDGQLAPTLAALLGWPHASVVIGTEFSDGRLRARKELWGGMTLLLDVEPRHPRYLSGSPGTTLRPGQPRPTGDARGDDRGDRSRTPHPTECRGRAPAST